MIAFAAWTYALLALLPILLQLGVLAGAPLGKFTVGGRFDGRLPPLWRALALVQAALLGGMALSVLDRAGVLGLGWPAVAFWGTLALTCLTLLGNAASPSPAERRLWTPVIALMLAAILVVAWLSAGG